MDALANLANQGGPLRCLNPHTFVAIMDITIGASGAISATDAPFGFSITQSTTGRYALVYPPCIKAVIITTVENPDVSVPATKGVVTAKSATVGTATISTLDDAAAEANPESAAHLIITLFLKAFDG